VLTTAGGLVFQGVRHDLTAYDAHSGAEVWHYNLGASAIAPPISYTLDGTQYIAIMVGNGGGNGEGASNSTDVRVPGRLLTFRLGGAAVLAAYPAHTRTFVDVAKAEPPDGDTVAGGIYFARYCTVCHQANFIYPDLRQSQALLSKSHFQAIVGDGALQNMGMASFSRFLDPHQVESIRAYLLAKYSAATHQATSSN
jgi:mono/diheme cytochrome c family protein